MSFPHSKPITFKKIYFSACLKNTECPDDRPTCIAGICSGNRNSKKKMVYT